MTRAQRTLITWSEEQQRLLRETVEKHEDEMKVMGIDPFVYKRDGSMGPNISGVFLFLLRQDADKKP